MKCDVTVNVPIELHSKRQFISETTTKQHFFDINENLTLQIINLSWQTADRIKPAQIHTSFGLEI